MSLPILFTPMKVGNLELVNRIVIAPMQQYSAEDGQMNDWHLMHLGQLASSGAAAVTIEGAAVSPEGRTTYGDAGLYSDDTEASMARVVLGVRRWSDMPIGIQLNHAGRKGSRQKPWEGGAQIPPGQPNGWKTYAPSPIAFAAADTPPVALDRDGLAAIRNAFAAAARRASRLGLDFIQILGAHGYLLHEFLSPLSNRRDDEYGGSLENRMRFPLEVFDAVRDAFAHDRPSRCGCPGLTGWKGVGPWSRRSLLSKLFRPEAAPRSMFQAAARVHRRRFRSDPAIRFHWREQSGRRRRCLSLPLV